MLKLTSNVDVIVLQLHNAVQQQSNSYRQSGTPSEGMDALKHQLDCYKTAAKQLSVLLVHRNKEIEGGKRADPILNLLNLHRCSI